MIELAAEAQRFLVEAGWFPGRRVDISAWHSSYAKTGLVMHEAAANFLSEFGGLKVGHRGPGVTSSREAFDLDPALVVGEEDRFIEWGQEIGRRLFPVGGLDHDRYFLGIDEHAELYVIELFVATFDKMPTGLNNLVLGVMPRRIA